MSVRLFLKRIIHGSFGNWAPNERVILDALLAALSPDQARALSHQVAQVEIIHRSAHGRLVLPFYSSTDPPEKLSVPEGEFCLAHVQFADDSHKGSVRVQTYNGHFRSLEFSRSPKDFSTLRVTSIETRSILANALNRLEHGSNNA